MSLASSGPASPWVATNSPEFFSSLLRLCRAAIWLSMSCLDHARYVSTPPRVPVIRRIYFILSSLFRRILCASQDGRRPGTILDMPGRDFWGNLTGPVAGQNFSDFLAVPRDAPERVFR